MRRRRLFWQIFPSYVLLTAGLLAVLLLEGTGRLREFYLDQTAEELATSARLFAEAAQAPLQTRDGDALEAMARQYGKAAGLRITVVLPDGRVLAESEENPAVMENHRTRLEVANALDTQRMAWDVRHSSTLGQEFLYVAVPLPPGGEPSAVVRLSKTAAAVDGALQVLERRIIFGALLAIAVAVALAWLVTRRISRPLEWMTRGAEQFGRGDLDHRLPIGGSREIAALAETLNAMAAQLGRSIQESARQRDELEAVLSSMQEGVLAVDNGGTVLDINPAGAEMFQLDAARIRGRKIHEVLRKADLLSFVEAALSGPLPRQAEIALYDKQKRLLIASGTALHDASGARIGVLIVLRDAPPPASGSRYAT